MHPVSECGDLWRPAPVLATIALAFLALLALATPAGAAETVYWNNYEDDTLSFANLDGSGGGLLNTSGVEIDSPEGMAYDTVTNRIYLASESGGTQGEIVFVNLDGSGAGVFTATGAPVDTPEGIAIDPGSRTIYWTNTGSPESVAWAKLDGTAGGALNTTGATLKPGNRIAFDPVSRRVYWTNGVGGPDSIGFAAVDNSGGGDISLSVPEPPENLTGLAIDPAGGRLFWLDSEQDRIGFQPLAGGAGGELDLSGAVLDGPYGLAIDPALSRIYWANYGVGNEPAAALGFANLGGGAGNIAPATAPVNGPQDPLILKSPTGTGAPAITRNPAVPAHLSCSQGSWAGDYPGSFVYQAPRTLSYRWLRNGDPVPGGTATMFTATAGGNYACEVTATNQAGFAIQTSAAVTVEPMRLPINSMVKLTTKRKAKADPGDLVTFRVKAFNQGNIQSKAARVCVKLPKKARDDLRNPKCKKLAPLGARAKRTLKFGIKVKRGADKGAGKLTFQLKGTPGKAAKSRIIVR